MTNMFVSNIVNLLRQKLSAFVIVNSFKFLINISEQLLGNIYQELKRINYHKRTQLLSEKINNVRNKHIGHWDYDVKTQTNLSSYGMPWNELRNVTDAMMETIQCLSFGTHLTYDLPDYSTRYRLKCQAAKGSCCP